MLTIVAPGCGPHVYGDLFCSKEYEAIREDASAQATADRECYSNLDQLFAYPTNDLRLADDALDATGQPNGTVLSPRSLSPEAIDAYKSMIRRQVCDGPQHSTCLVLPGAAERIRTDADDLNTPTMTTS